MLLICLFYYIPVISFFFKNVNYGYKLVSSFNLRSLYYKCDASNQIPYLLNSIERLTIFHVFIFSSNVVCYELIVLHSFSQINNIKQHPPKCCHFSLVVLAGVQFLMLKNVCTGDFFKNLLLQMIIMLT